MSSVIVRGMEIPPQCASCPCWTLVPVKGTARDVCNVKNMMIDNPFTLPEWCPLEPAPGWVSVEDQLPEPGHYLAAKRQSTGAVQIAIGHYGGQYGWSGNGNFRGVFAWMPLPEPPETKEENDG